MKFGRFCFGMVMASLLCWQSGQAMETNACVPGIDYVAQVLVQSAQAICTSIPYCCGLGVCCCCCLCCAGIVSEPVSDYYHGQNADEKYESRWCALCKQPASFDQVIRFACDHTFHHECWSSVKDKKICPACHANCHSKKT